MQIAKLDPGLLTDPTIRYAQDFKPSDLTTDFFEKVQYFNVENSLILKSDCRKTMCFVERICEIVGNRS